MWSGRKSWWAALSGLSCCVRELVSGWSFRTVIGSWRTWIAPVRLLIFSLLPDLTFPSWCNCHNQLGSWSSSCEILVPRKIQSVSRRSEESKEGKRSLSLSLNRFLFFLRLKLYTHQDMKPWASPILVGWNCFHPLMRKRCSTRRVTSNTLNSSNRYSFIYLFLTNNHIGRW